MATEGQLVQQMDLNGISEGNQERIFNYLKVLNDKDPATAQHSMRVALLAGTMARVEAIPGITPKMLIWAGALHDIGKVAIPLETLAKTEKFTKKDMKAMEPHVILGWQMLDKLHDYTAAIIVRHHQYGPKPYPAKLPALPDWLEPKKALIDGSARLLALADYFDALTTRVNDKHKKGKKTTPLTGDQRRELFYQANADKGRLINTLEEIGVIKFRG